MADGKRKNRRKEFELSVLDHTKHPLQGVNVILNHLKSLSKGGHLWHFSLVITFEVFMNVFADFDNYLLGLINLIYSNQDIYSSSAGFERMTLLLTLRSMDDLGP